MTCDMYVTIITVTTALDLPILKVTRDDSQRRFLVQHGIAMLEQCCDNSKQCRNNVATRVKTEEDFILCQIKQERSLPVWISFISGSHPIFVSQQGNTRLIYTEHPFQSLFRFS